MKLIILKYLSKIYELVTNFRSWLYDKKLLESYKINLPIICIGNLTAGGNSKTPLSIYIYKLLKESGYQPIVLLRGYKGSELGPIEVTKDLDVNAVGDEAVMMHHLYNLKVLVSRDRVAGARFIESRKLADVIILDDGLQHQRLIRDLNILCINATTPDDLKEFSEGNLLPFGLFRENRAKGLKRVQLAVFINRSLSKAQNIDYFKLAGEMPEGVISYQGFLSNYKVITAWSDHEWIDYNQKVVSICSIANPEGFFKSVRDLGFNVCHEKSFPDHYQFSWQDIKELLARFPDCKLICTTKDIVKINKEWSDNILVLKVELKIEPENAFQVQILKAINNSKSAC
jgi:tetraacyldisaccharide 4'-kinase